MKTRTYGAMFVLGGLVAVSPLGQYRCLAGHQSAPKLPKPVAETVRRTFPGARVRAVEIERSERGLRIYEVEISRNGIETDAQISGTGALVRVKTHIPAKELPPKVTRALERIAAGSRVRESEKVETFAGVRHGKIAPLPKPLVSYEIAFRSAGRRKSEVRISLSGKVLATSDGEDDEENDEVEQGDQDDNGNHDDQDNREDDD